MIRRCACLLLFALALVFETAPAASSAPVGLTPDTPGAVRMTPRATPAQVTTTPRISYDGGPVLHANRTHLIFWAPSNRPDLTFEPGYTALIQRFMRDMSRASHSTGSDFGITGQYRDAGGPAAYASTYGGSVLDTHPVPPSGCYEPATGPGWTTTCLTDAQLQQELTREIAVRHLPTRADDIYFLVTPDGFGSCLQSGPSSCALGGSESGYCGYHSVSGNGVLYAVIPYNAVPGHCQSSQPRPNLSPADPALSTISHEQAETITDPQGDAWVNSDGSEIADLCLTSFGPPLGGSGNSSWNEAIGGHHYWLQELYSRITGGCAARPQRDVVRIHTPVRIRAGRPARLIARATQPGGRIVAYNWNFGDGRGGRGRRPLHVYDRAGAYRVYLRVTDSAGNWAYAKRTVTVKRR